VETVLAVCAAFHSCSVCRWLPAAFGFDFEAGHELRALVTLSVEDVED